MKSKDELNALKEEVETVSRKLAELTEEELAQVSGGVLLDNIKLGFEPAVIEALRRLHDDPPRLPQHPA